jgi:hypothetical protein
MCCDEFSRANCTGISWVARSSTLRPMTCPMRIPPQAIKTLKVRPQ